MIMQAGLFADVDKKVMERSFQGQFVDHEHDCDIGGPSWSRCHREGLLQQLLSKTYTKKIEKTTGLEMLTSRSYRLAKSAELKAEVPTLQMSLLKHFAGETMLLFEMLVGRCSRPTKLVGPNVDQPIQFLTNQSWLVLKK